MHYSVTADMSKRDPTLRRQVNARRPGCAASARLTTSAVAASLRKTLSHYTLPLSDSAVLINLCTAVNVSVVVGACSLFF